MPKSIVPLNGTPGIEGNACRSAASLPYGSYDRPADAVLSAQLDNMAQQAPGGITARPLRERLDDQSRRSWDFYVPGLRSGKSMTLPHDIARVSRLQEGGKYRVHLRLDISPGFVPLSRFYADFADQVESTRILLRIRDVGAGVWMAAWTSLAALSGNFSSLKCTSERRQLCARQADLPLPHTFPYRYATALDQLLLGVRPAVHWRWRRWRWRRRRERRR